MSPFTRFALFLSHRDRAWHCTIATTLPALALIITIGVLT